MNRKQRISSKIKKIISNFIDERIPLEIINDIFLDSGISPESVTKLLELSKRLDMIYSKRSVPSPQSEDLNRLLADFYHLLGSIPKRNLDELKVNLEREGFPGIFDHLLYKYENIYEQAFRSHKKDKGSSANSSDQFYDPEHPENDSLEKLRYTHLAINRNFLFDLDQALGQLRRYYKIPLDSEIINCLRSVISIQHQIILFHTYSRSKARFHHFDLSKEEFINTSLETLNEFLSILYKLSSTLEGYINKPFPKLFELSIDEKTSARESIASDTIEGVKQFINLLIQRAIGVTIDLKKDLTIIKRSLNVKP